MSGRIEDSLKELNELPELEPPQGLEQQTLEAMAAAAATRSANYLARAAAWIVAIGVASVLALQLVDVDPPAEEVETVAANELFDAYLARSTQLEQLMYQLPPPRTVTRVSTAGTIVGLEDQLALIDAELMRAEPAEPEYRVALARERFEVVNALVNVRYAQSAAFVY